MVAALQARPGGGCESFSVTVVDVDEHPELELKWGDKVPVLLEGDVEICHYFLDEGRLASHQAAWEKPA